MFRALLLILIPFVILLTGCATNYAQQPNTQQFIQQMAAKHQFDQQQLTQLFSEVQPDQQVIKLMKKPHEALPWYVYRTTFVTPERARAGAIYWCRHANTLTYAEHQYGVPAEIIVSILGVETRYGQNQGNKSVLRSLATLSFNYPPRAPYFRSELEQFLLLTRDISLDPRLVQGSYAGALGAPQFMPSSYRQYAVAYQRNSCGNLFNNDDDAIVSIAHYLNAKGWQRGGKIAIPVGAKNLSPLPYILQGRNGPEYWRGCPNFSVIMRYNTSPLYAMAVYQLGEQIKLYHRKLLRA